MQREDVALSTMALLLMVVFYFTKSWAADVTASSNGRSYISAHWEITLLKPMQFLMNIQLSLIDQKKLKVTEDIK